MAAITDAVWGELTSRAQTFSPSLWARITRARMMATPSGSAATSSTSRSAPRPRRGAAGAGSTPGGRRRGWSPEGEADAAVLELLEGPLAGFGDVAVGRHDVELEAARRQPGLEEQGVQLGCELRQAQHLDMPAEGQGERTFRSVPDHPATRLQASRTACRPAAERFSSRAPSASSAPARLARTPLNRPLRQSKRA